MKKRLLSGVKPTGQVHIGNYFGAMKQFVEMQDKYDCLFMIADYHALNSVQDREKMRELIYDLVLDYLAIGIDPEKSVIFQQSQVGEHTELAWIFDTLTTMPYLMRAHAFKDAEAKNKDINVGTFNYPMLMAADILLYSPEYVPVGMDQKQHIEITRDTAQKFNNTYSKEVFNMPKELVIENVATVPGVDGRKMSKSYGNVIPLFAEYDELKKLVMSIVTDSSGDMPINVYNMHKLFRTEDELTKIYEENAGKYKILKELLLEDLENFIAPMREKRKALAKDLDAVRKIVEEGSVMARELAADKMREVKEAVGVKL